MLILRANATPFTKVKIRYVSPNTDWTTYTDPGGRYSFDIPPNWTVNVEPGSTDGLVKPRVGVYHYEEEGYPYSILILQDDGPDPSLQTTRTITQDMSYRGRRFKKRVFYYVDKDKVVYMTIKPEDTDFKAFKVISVNLPRTNTEKYLEEVDAILSTLNFNSR